MDALEILIDRLIENADNSDDKGMWHGHVAILLLAKERIAEMRGES